MTSPYAAYQKAWREANPEKVQMYKEKQSEYNTHRTITKRCPVCRKQKKFRKDTLLLWKTIRCNSCHAKLKVVKTLSVSIKNRYGVKLKVVQ